MNKSVLELNFTYDRKKLISACSPLPEHLPNTKIHSLISLFQEVKGGYTIKQQVKFPGVYISTFALRFIAVSHVAGQFSLYLSAPQIFSLRLFSLK